MHGKRSLVAFTALLLGSPLAMAQETIEEVVVTGSLLKRDSFDSASPLKVIDDVELRAEATPALGEVIANQTFNYGSDVFSNNYTARFQEGNSTAANFRGLGANATLNLINGKRTLENNLNNFIPQIAIQRIDILKDGAAALYGSDAVAGVLNVIPKTRFEGIETSVMYQSDYDGDVDESVFNLIFGSPMDNGHFVFAAEYRDRGKLEQTERSNYLKEGFSSSGTGNPGTYLVPTRDPLTGAVTGSEQLRDPGCGVAASPGGNGGGGIAPRESRVTDSALGNKRNNLSGSIATSGGQPICQFQFGEFFNFVNPNEQFSVYSHFEHNFSDSLSWNTDIIYSRQETEDRGSPNNPGGRIGEVEPVTGEHPGNPYTAGVYTDPADPTTFQPVYALDANGDGIADRDPANNQVILSADPFNPASGVGFNEDVTIAALRLFGKMGTLPTNLNEDGSNIGAGQYDAYNFRISSDLNLELNDVWDVNLSGTWQKNETDIQQKNQSLNAVQLGLEGRLGATGDLWYNPFSTVGVNCTDRVCEDTGAGFDNSIEAANLISYIETQQLESDLYNLQILATGELPWQLPAGGIGIAFGYEWRKVETFADDGPQANSCNRWINACGFDWDGEQRSDEVFGELNIPLFTDHEWLGTAELQIAGRYADYGDYDDFTPKYAGLWQPTDWLSLRASYSEAYIVPTLSQQFASETSFLQTTTDPIFLDSQATFRTNSYAGNQDLQPESADVYNIGASLSLFDDTLRISVDYSDYDFQDRISRTTAQQVIDVDNTNFLNFYGLDNNAQATQAQQEEWATTLQAPEITRANPNAGIFTITEVQTEWLNAQSMEHKAWDFTVDYAMELGNWGALDLGLAATYVDEYAYDLGIGAPGVGDGVGFQNDTIQEIPPTPEWRVRGQANWNLNNWNVLLATRWSDSVDLDAAFFGGDFACQDTWSGPAGCETDDLWYVDATITYVADGLIGDRTTVFEFGGRNIFDEEPDELWYLSGIETFLHDPRGGTWYLRVTQDL
jgi:outer membrane receptor protein involved in Fe transport